jgi:outer membrane protein TolC
MRPVSRSVALAATLLAPAACRQEQALWDDQAFEKLAAVDAGVPFETEQPPPPPPPAAQPPTTPWGAGPRDMAFLIGFALQNNPATRATWERARATAAQWAMIESLWWPRLNAFGFAGYVQEALPQQNDRLLDRGPQGDLGLELTWELIDFGRRDALTDEARRALAASNLTYNRALQTLVFEVQTAYFMLDSRLALEEAAEQDVETTRVQMEAVEEKLELGLSIMPDVLVARQRWEQARFRLEQARSEAFDARGMLARRLGLSADVPVEILPLRRMPLPDGLGDSVERLMAVGGRDRPDLLAAGQRVRAAEARIKKAEADFLPIVSLYGNVANKWFNYTPDPVDQVDRIDTTLPTYMVGLKGTWLLFDGFERVNNVRKARAERNEAAAELAKLRLEALNDVWSAYFKQLAAQRQYAFGESLVAASQDSYDAMFEAYVTGLRTLPELLQAEFDLAAARATLVRTRADLLDSAARLAYAVGSPDTAGRYAQKVDPRPDGERVR